MVSSIITTEHIRPDAAIYVAGHRGLVGSAIVRRLRQAGFHNLLLPSRDELDLCDQSAVQEWFDTRQVEYVFLVAGKVGGIMPNSTRPAEFLYDNLMIHANVIHAAHSMGVKKLLYLGSSCIYPRDCPQPIREEYLLTGRLEPTNEAYALAKIAGIKMCQTYQRQYGDNFISGMPSNLYGPHDNFDLRDAHVLPALMRKFHEARLCGASAVTVWGSGSPRREFLHVDDLAEACLFLMRHYSGESHVNIGTGVDGTIRDLAELIRAVVAPEVRIEFDSSKPDGTPRKVLDASRLATLGWRAKIDLEQGIRATYAWFADHYETAIQGRHTHASMA